MQHENQATITAWALETFGPPSSNAVIVARANREMSELLSALASDGRHPGAVEECADVAIVLLRAVSGLCGWFERNSRLYAHGRTALQEACYVNHQLAKAMRLLAGDDDSEIALRLVFKILHRLDYLVWFLGDDLQAAIDRKMAINRKRQWVMRGDGTADHYGKGSRHVDPSGEEVA